MSELAPTDKKIFFTKNDPDDIRLGDVVTSDSNVNTLKSQLIITGYPDDRGIENNGGRLGAKDGPVGIRQILYKLVANNNYRGRITDIGDFSLHTSLESDHMQVEKTLDILNKNQNSILSFGGGHDWAFCDVSSFISKTLSQNKRPLLLNIDAHLDVRSDKKGINSGTSFYRLLERYPEQFDFYEIGIQSFCNSQKHFEYLESKPSVKVFRKEDIDDIGIKKLIEQIKAKHHKQPTFLSLDIDAISATDAPGCSQSWPGGLSFDSVMLLLRELRAFSEWTHMGIYEVSPILDVQRITQKSAALAAYEFICQKLGRHEF